MPAACGLVAACDIAVSVDTAKYCLSEVRLGLIPATISPYVIRAMGAARRASLLPHRRALRRGRGACASASCTRWWRPTHSTRRWPSIAQTLVQAGPAAVKACKQLLQDVASREITHALIAMTVEGIADIRVSDEGREGVQSFLEKRKPSWLL